METITLDQLIDKLYLLKSQGCGDYPVQYRFPFFKTSDPIEDVAIGLYDGQPVIELLQ